MRLAPVDLLLAPLNFWINIYIQGEGGTGGTSPPEHNFLELREWESILRKFQFFVKFFHVFIKSFLKTFKIFLKTFKIFN